MEFCSRFYLTELKLNILLNSLRRSKADRVALFLLNDFVVSRVRSVVVSCCIHSQDAPLLSQLVTQFCVGTLSAHRSTEPPSGIEPET